ncbi:unnamed protein product, partial [Mesorhabditis belari]|uniref:Glycosyltransferase family 92 protein n=1 Tax=Mesorhabditis belari TaxID=2138241 RepID=A0AAF3FSZ6_9BILA
MICLCGTLSWTIACPSKCKYTSIDITTRKYQYFNDVKEITVKKWRRGYVNAKIGVRKMFGPEAQENGITSCLKPLLWFNDWRRLLLYFELARGIGYTRFLIAWNFVSSDVKKVIDHYRNLSLVDIPYPITANDPQMIYANEFVREVSSTDVTKFFLNKKMRSMNSKDAIYLKINYEKDSGNDSLLPNIPLIEKDPELINRIRDRVKEIFGDKTPDYDRTILERYNLCSKDDKTCESPIGRCVSKLENAEKWIQNDAPAWDKLYVL